MTRWTYVFGGGKADGSARDKQLLGGKGANLAEMTQDRDWPVPPGLHHHDRVLRLQVPTRRSAVAGRTVSMDDVHGERGPLIEEIHGPRSSADP